MEMKRLYLSELFKQQKKLEQGHLIWPFFTSKQASQEALLKAAKRHQVYWLSGQQELFVQAVKKADTWQVENILLGDASASWEQVLTLLETACRQQFLTYLCLKIEATEILQEWLMTQQFVLTKTGWQKNLTADIGLVLGGGGAHGSYQIGVWQALLEKNISFKLISGTSVGALNGALIAQGDFQAAYELWEQIETTRVLAVTYEQLDTADFTQQLDELRNFMKDALHQKGVSTAPLRELLLNKIDFATLQASLPLYIVTTKVPHFTEQVIWLNRQNKAAMIDWLLASSAFFPLMSLVEINGDYFADGGYRNNLPQDIALEKGAQDLIVVDVSGPGIDRKPALSDTTAQIKLKTPWSLGDLLIFQPSRCQGNMSLGYLETKRQLEDLPGTWYTFTSYAELETLTHQFLLFLKNYLEPPLEMPFDEPIELLSLGLLELWGRWLKISPLTVYSTEQFCQQLLSQIKQTKPASVTLTVQEQWMDYWQTHHFFSDYQQTMRLVGSYRNKSNQKLIREIRFSRLTVAALFLLFLQEEECDGTRI